MQLIAQCYHYLFWGALLLLGAGLIAVLVYIIRSHLTVDRIIGINLIGTLVVIAISILTYLLGEDYLAAQPSRNMPILPATLRRDAFWRAGCSARFSCTLARASATLFHR